MTKWAGNKVWYLAVCFLPNFVESYHYHNLPTVLSLTRTSLCVFTLVFIRVPDFYHHSQADYNMHRTTGNLSYVMNIYVAGLLGATVYELDVWTER
jgi:hypothetical protein